MTEIRLIAVDLDGTLLNERQQISPRTQRAIADAIGHGIDVVLASARPPRSVKAFYDLLKLSTPSIHYNGGLVFEFATRTTLASHALDVGTARAICELADERLTVLAERSDQSFASRDDDDDRFITQTRRLFPHDVVGPWRDWMEQDVHKLMFAGEQQWLTPLAALLRREFSHAANVIYAEPNLIQIGAPGVSKGSALRKLLGQRGIDPKQVLAIGDADNDIEMLQLAGLTVAMGNATEPTKRAARHITATNSLDGCALAIEKWVMR